MPHFGPTWSLVAALVVTPLAAQHQTTHATGAVVRPAGADTVPVPGVMVVLHKIGRATQGPVDSMRSDPNGRFSFAFPTDMTANFLLSARFVDIAYFSTPITFNKQAPDTGIKLVVYDSSSTAPVRTRSRTIVVSLPDAVGLRTVVDWFVIANTGAVTRVSGRDSGATWTAPLPAGVRNTEVGDSRLSQFSPDAVRFRNDSVLVDAPLSPGQKELFVQYQLPADLRTFSLPLAGIDSVDVLLEDTNVRFESPGWVARDSQQIEGRRLRRYSHPGGAPQEVVVRFPGSSIPPRCLLPWFVVGFVLLSAGGWFWATRGRRDPPPGPAARSAVELADRIAALDEAHLGGDGERPAEERAAYRRERTELKAALDAALARGRRRT